MAGWIAWRDRTSVGRELVEAVAGSLAPTCPREGGAMNVPAIRRSILRPIRELAGGLRRRLGRLRRLPERWMHPRRRRRASGRLARLAERLAGGERRPLRVLVLCHGNICRSPYAARRIAALLGETLGRHGVVVESGGFIGPGRPPPLTAREVAAERGADVSGHRSSLVSPERILGSDLVMTMSAEQARWVRELAPEGPAEVLLLGDLDPERPERRDIRDPVEQPAEVFRSVFDRIDRCIDGLARALGGSGDPGSVGAGARGAETAGARARDARTGRVEVDQTGAGGGGGA